MAQISRRQFIKIGAAGAGAAALSASVGIPLMRKAGAADVDPKTDGDRVVPSFCELCFWKCGVQAHVKDGRVTKVVGNPDHPLSQGKLCPRGYGATGMLYDPDRLRKPLVRVGGRGEQRFAETDWRTALDLVASKMKDLREKHGPEAFALFNHGYGGSWFAQLTKAFGSPNVGAPSYAQCRGPREAGFGLTFGQSLGSPENIDIENARCLVLIGSHLGENMHNTQVQEMAEAIGRGAQLVVVDPRYSTAAGKAKFWLPIKPGTDIALLLAWMNVIIEEKRYDADYLAKYATGFEELKQHVVDKTPEWAHARTGIRADLIRDSARLIASARPAALVHPGRHVTWYGDDSQRLRAIAILNALLGSWGRRGGFLQFSKMPLSPFPAPKYEGTMRAPADKPKAGGFPFSDELLASGLRDASVPGTAEYDIKGWMVYGTNLIQTLPDPRKTMEAIQKLDFLVSVDILPAEICGWSDVVLPECTYLEREDDLWAPAYKQPFIAIRQRAVEPLHESKPGWWIARELGQRLGLERFFPFESANQYISKRLELSGLADREQELRTKGVLIGKRAPCCEEEGLAIEFGTESQKIELYSTGLKDAGFDPLPQFYPPEEGPAGMLRLITGRSPAHTFGRTTNNRLLLDAYPENELWVHRSSAMASDGTPLKSGERVMLVNQDGAKSGPVKVKVTERIRGDCVYLVHGFGHDATGLKAAYGRGASDSALTTRFKTDPIMGGTGTHVNFVRMERA